MNVFSSRRSWDTAVKHLARHGVLDNLLTLEQINSIPRSNLSRWKQESEDKYSFCEINSIIKQEVELINQSSRIKKINESYFKLADTFHEVISNIKGVKSLLKSKKKSL